MRERRAVERHADEPRLARGNRPDIFEQRGIECGADGRQGQRSAPAAFSSADLARGSPHTACSGTLSRTICGTSALRCHIGERLALSSHTAPSPFQPALRNRSTADQRKTAVTPLRSSGGFVPSFTSRSSCASEGGSIATRSDDAERSPRDDATQHPLSEANRARRLPDGEPRFVDGGVAQDITRCDVQLEGDDRQMTAGQMNAEPAAGRLARTTPRTSAAQ